MDLKARRTRLSLFLSFRCSCCEEERVAVAQMMVPPASVKTTLPSFQRERCEPLPLTGLSRLAIHKTVGRSDLVNHTEKQKALSPTWKNPAEKSPLDETMVSFCFSTESEEPSGSLSIVPKEVGTKRRRRKSRTMRIA